MLNALGELIFGTIQKQVEEAQQRQAAALGLPVPAPPAAPPQRAGAPQMGTPAPVRPAPVAAAPVPMGRMPDALPYNAIPPLDPLAPLEPVRPFASPLLDALRGGPGLVAAIVVAQVLGPPASLHPHSAPTDTL